MDAPANVFECYQCLSGGELGWGELLVLLIAVVVIAVDWIEEKK